jgi:hypothetical protein
MPARRFLDQDRRPACGVRLRAIPCGWRHRRRGRACLQIGLRYTPNDSWFDFDILAGNAFDATSAKFFTFGVTVRF